jgi:hypothetical protein
LSQSSQIWTEKVGKLHVISKRIDEVEEKMEKSEKYPREKRGSGQLEKREEVSLRLRA